MRTGDIALVKKFRLQDDPFKLMSIESITVPGKVISVHYPSFTVKFDEPLPDGVEYQEFHVNHIPEAVKVKDGNLNTVLSVILEIAAQAKQCVDPHNPEKTMEKAALSLFSALMRIEQICKEHVGELDRPRD